MKYAVQRMLVTFALIASAGQAHAWSGPGHQAVCQIALLELGKSNPTVQSKVKKIIATDNDNFKPFATSCTWADESAQKNARPNEHFVNFERSLELITTDGCGAAQECLFKAIKDDQETLKNGSGEEQLEALKYLGHWIGDLHQPLHISYADDRGGNQIPVTNAGGCSELHGTWDRCIPERVRIDIGASTGATALGKKLQAEITDDERAKWRKGTIVDWAEESYTITRDEKTKYCLIQGNRCCYDTTTCENTAGDDKKKQTKRLKPLPNGYRDAQADVAKEQLKKAGVRLAVILEAQLQ